MAVSLDINRRGIGESGRITKLKAKVDGHPGGNSGKRVGVDHHPLGSDREILVSQLAAGCGSEHTVEGRSQSIVPLRDIIGNRIHVGLRPVVIKMG